MRSSRLGSRSSSIVLPLSASHCWPHLSASRLTAPDSRSPLQALAQGNMSTFGGEAEWQPSIAGEPSAGPHSHNHQPSQEFPIYTLYLENLGAQFTSPSTSRRESYDTNLSGDEAFAQPEASATPRADHTSWLSETPNGGRLTQPPPTPRLTLVHELPYLTRPEYTEFERRRRAERNRRKPAFGK